MKGRMQGLVAAMAMAAAAACSDASPTASLVEAGDAFAQAKSRTQLAFSYTQSNSTEGPQTSSGAAGAIDFTGSLTTGNPCVEVSATHTSTPSTVRVTVSAASTSAACIQVITHNNYTGRVSGLEPGTYTFVVVHALPGQNETVHSNQVVVG